MMYRTVRRTGACPAVLRRRPRGRGERRARGVEIERCDDAATAEECDVRGYDARDALAGA